MPPQTVLIVGGNGFLGSSISKHALAKGWKVISISQSGKPYTSPTSSHNRPQWSKSPNIRWHSADALRPETYKDLIDQCDAVVHTVGILLESDYKPRGGKGLLESLGGALNGVARGWGLTSGGRDGGGNPFHKRGGEEASRSSTRGEMSYEVMNRDTAISVAHTFLSSLKERSTTTTTTTSSSHRPPHPFIYISAEDIFRPIVDSRYISTKRQAERTIQLLSDRIRVPAYRTSRDDQGEMEKVAKQESDEAPIPDDDGAGLTTELRDEIRNGEVESVPLMRPVFLRPGLMYHPHTRPISTLPAALLDLSSTFHSKPPLPLPIPTPAEFLSSSKLVPESWRPLSRLLTLPPLHVDTVAKAVCKAIEDSSVQGSVGVHGIRRLAGWKEDGQELDPSDPPPATRFQEVEEEGVRSGQPPEASAVKSQHPSFSGAQRRQFSNLATTVRSIERRIGKEEGRTERNAMKTSRRSFFSLPDLGKLASEAVSAVRERGGGSIDERGHQVYRTEKDLNVPKDLLYEIVSDVQSYHQFIPYCRSSRVLGEEPRFKRMREQGLVPEDGATQVQLAELTVGFGSFNESYTSEVRMKKSDWVVATSTPQNPIFSHLRTEWSFEDLSRHQGSLPSSPSTRIRFDIQFSFKNPLYASVAGQVLELMSTKMMDAFQQRVDQVIASRSSRR
ncbi:hypothetical protein IE53DRAFT_385722 [Violaceomyces palustris]|uniref:Uncharacterized protein n=1 Tax=Violaceomyces palustris TaxID=1673888 RepID=A0ACD0P1K4_9BASI|nr:hypothetical protein IE53DRAFT_385722 [Violaceomyces palustris]